MSANQLDQYKHNQLVDPQAQLVVEFLKSIGLPSDNIIAKQEEREVISRNLSSYIISLPEEIKKDARYLSKFVVGAGFGLFDYSLNAIWNEVIIALHKKAIAYGLDIFFDAAVGGKNREFFKDENDLPSLKDIVLLDTCQKLELISNTTHRKLRHILEMRNDIGISHPTNYTINAFELLGWLQTSIKDVLNDRPTEAALQVQAFIQNLRTYTKPLDPTNLVTIKNNIKTLPSIHCGNVLRTMFGIFVDPEIDIQVRKNIALISPTVWESTPSEIKYKLGLILEGYNTNLHQAKYELGDQFFQVVDGNSFKSNSERAITVDALLDQLREKHYGWDNYAHEAPIAYDLASYINSQNDILDNFSQKLIQTIVLCRIGRGLPYCAGVSPRGKEYYNKIISFFGDKYTPDVFIAFSSVNIYTRFEKPICRTHACDILKKLRMSVVNERILECIDFLIENLPKTETAIYDPKFKELTAPFLTWK